MVARIQGETRNAEPTSWARRLEVLRPLVEHKVAWIIHGTSFPQQRLTPYLYQTENCRAGHTSLSTTARYTQVATTTIARTESPLDRLRLEVVPPA